MDFALAAVLQQAGQSDSQRDLRRLARAVLVNGEKERALEVRRVLQKSQVTLKSAGLSRYLDLWLVDEKRNFDTLLIGPAPLGPIGADALSLAQSGRVLRVLMPGVTEWSSENDLASGAADTIYANGQTTEWLTQLQWDERRELLSKFQDVVVKHNEPWIAETNNVRIANPVKDLFFSGSPNMAQIMILDQLERGQSQIFVAGVSFFLGERTYRENQLRVFGSSGIRSDERGSTGREFERCRAIATHDQTVNRAVLRNLFSAGVISGTDDFKRVLELDNRAYCIELDQLYGLRRI